MNYMHLERNSTPLKIKAEKVEKQGSQKTGKTKRRSNKEKEKRKPLHESFRRDVIYS